MSISQRDYILRMIEQLAAFIARIMGARKAGDLELARREVDAAMGALFGPLAGMLEKVDAASAASLLGEPEKIRAYAALLAERAAIDEASEGGSDKARAERRRALLLQLEAARKKPPADERALSAIAELAKTVDRARLSEPYRRELDALLPDQEA